MAEFLDKESATYHSGALLYALAGYLVGFAGILHESLWVNVIATVLLGHAMVIAAYMVHECSHNTVFISNRDNARLGEALLWVVGSNYGTYEDIRYKHFRHHVDNDDVVWFDYEVFFKRNPLVLHITKALEWCYIPAHCLIMHFVTMLSGFLIPERRDQRGRNLFVILLRGGLFLLLCLLSPKAGLLYVLAYMMMVTVLRFMDSLEHDYPYRLNLYTDEPSPHKGDLGWEQEHTFSPVISLRVDCLNWLVLNFGYHNAHHAKPTTPWFRLPDLHRELFGSREDGIIPFRAQLKIFHKYRINRIMHDDPASSNRDVEGIEFLRAAQRSQVDGGNAASFLTSV